MEQLFIAALVAETLTNIFKAFYDPEKRAPNIDVILAASVGVIISVGTQTDLLASAGLNMIHPLFGQVVTGLIFARGANFVHDLMKMLQG